MLLELPGVVAASYSPLMGGEGGAAGGQVRIEIEDR
jgi:hypothetical protein